MELNDRVTELEDEIKVLKNEVQAVLLDLRDTCLDRENPFNPNMSPMMSQPIIINQPPPIVEKEPEKEAAEEAEDLIPEESEGNELARVEEPASEPELVYQGGEELANEPEPVYKAEAVYKQELTAADETAPEEVKRAWRPEIGPGPSFKSREVTAGSNGKVDLATIDGLAQWVAETVKRLGRDRTEAIIDISEMMGHMAPELKNVLVKFISPTEDGYSGKVTTRDYLASLIDLDSLLGRDNKSELAMLYILCQENDDR